MVQGAAELLPVSSSAHVIVAEKLLGLDPTRPEMTLLLVMLHTGTMVAVILYFWRAWRENYFSSRRELWNFAQRVAVATVITGIIGLALKFLIEKFALRGVPQAEIELIFGNLALIGISLGVVGLLIIYAGLRAERPGHPARQDLQGSALIGVVQGLCLPFRGFSRSGATISAGLILGINKERVEEFSFALAVVLTPPVIAREIWRLLKAQRAFLRLRAPASSPSFGPVSWAWGSVAWPACWRSAGSPAGWSKAAGSSSGSTVSWPLPPSSGFIN